jgi:hypothetical protein
LELARVIGQHPNLAAKVELVFFDGEEAYDHFSETDGLYGSRLLCQAPRRRQTIPRRDLVRHGWRSLARLSRFPQDSPPKWREIFLQAAEALKLRSYFTYLDREMIDDHSPLNAIGIPTIDVIDFDYPPGGTPPGIQLIKLALGVFRSLDQSRCIICLKSR